LSYLLDTNVLSEIQKGEQCNEAVKAWWDATDVMEIYISVVVPGEIQRGIEKMFKKNPIRARLFESWLDSVIEEFQGRILSVDMATARMWGKMTSKRTLPLVDSLLAATSMVHGLILVTRNIKDIHDTGVSYLNPFEA
jgi:predicted nucleic acid-binding protein